MAVKILCDSSADFDIEEIKALDLLYVPIPVMFGDDTYIEGENITKDEFYEKLTTNPNFPTTSQPSPAMFLDYFKEAKKNNDEIVAILIPEALSGTFQNANMAKNMSDYDNIHIVDGFNIAAALRILIEHAVKLRDAGKSAADIALEITKLRTHTKVYAALDTLENLYRGGRLSKAAAGIGELANLKPVVTLDEKGAVAVCSKAIGKNKAIGNIIKHLDTLELDYNYPTYFVYSNDSANTLVLKDKLVAAGYDVSASKLCNLGPTLGTHVGIGAYGIAYVEKELD